MKFQLFCYLLVKYFNSIDCAKWKYEEKDVFTIKTDGCTIPGISDLHKKSQNVISELSDVEDCNKDREFPRAVDLLGNNYTHIFVIKDNFDFYNIRIEDEFNCCYKNFTNNAPVLENMYCKSFDDHIKVDKEQEFFQVECSYMGERIYTNYFAFVPKKQQCFKPKLPTNRFNVMVFGIESMSRMNFHRTMPKTVTFLKSKGSIELAGYGKLGDNSAPNLLPLLTGFSADEIKMNCVNHNVFDNDKCSFIWDYYKRGGYITALGADSDVGLLETFYDFKTQPTDYYLHSFITESSTNIGHNKPLNYYLCMGNQHYYKVLLDYIEALTSNYAKHKSKLFGFFWGESVSHDFLNGPVIMDDAYEGLLRRLNDNKYLDHSIIIFLSDHGFRWGDFVKTAQGHLEERLPLVSFLLPKTFKKKYKLAYKNLQENVNHLITPYDIHRTLMHLLNTSHLKSREIKSQQDKYSRHRGISLFSTIPRNRTCASVGIAEHWCVCRTGKNLAVESKSANEAATQLLSHLNKLLSPYPQCHTLKLNKIQSTTVTESHDKIRTYKVVLTAKPSDAIFDGTLLNTGAKWAVSGTVSRLDAYGQQGSCINKTRIKMYCHCKLI